MNLANLDPAIITILRDCGVDLDEAARKMLAKKILREMVDYHQFSWKVIMGSDGRLFASMRFTGMWAMRKSGLGWREIAEAFGMSDHPSAIYGVGRVERTPRLMEQARAILARVQPGVERAAAMGNNTKAA